MKRLRILHIFLNQLYLIMILIFFTMPTNTQTWRRSNILAQFGINSCISPMSDEFDFIYTGIESYYLSETLNIHPSPASDYIEIAGLSNNQQFKSWVEDIHIYNTLGEYVKFINLSEGFKPSEGSVRIDISKLPPGLYFIRFGNVARMFVKM